MKRIVFTSSCATIHQQYPEPHIFNEADHNQQSVKEVEEKGKDAAPLAKYRASKVLAEKGM